MTVRRAARVAAVLLVLTAIGFVIGVSAESDDYHSESTGVVDSHNEIRGSEEAEASERAEAAESAQANDKKSEESTVLGVDAESPALVAVAALASVALAVALWKRPTHIVATVAAAFAVAFAVFDIAEVAHQLDEDRTALAVLAVAIALGHAAARRRPATPHSVPTKP